MFLIRMLGSVCIDYLTNENFIHIEAVSTFILVFGAARNFTPIFGAVASNFYGRFKVIVVGSGITLMVSLTFYSNIL
ncbi:hypothetical protein LINPERHAP1_LOCUS34737 [Linum perenne]